MSAPVAPDPPPELPVFPSARGEPDQPGAFFTKFLAFLAWLTAFRAWLIEFGAFVEESGGAGDSGDGDTETVVTLQGFRPMVDGSNPPVFIIEDEGHDLIMTEA